MLQQSLKIFNPLILGLGPDAFFYVGKKGTNVIGANSIGFLIPYPASQNEKPLETHSGSKVLLKASLT